MKATRIVLLGFVFAIFAMAVGFEPVAAQCWSCIRPLQYDDDRGTWELGCHFYPVAVTEVGPSGVIHAVASDLDYVMTLRLEVDVGRRNC